MANQQGHGHEGHDREGGLTLQTFTRSTPPGRRPGQLSYPLRKYKQLIALWWRQTDFQEHQFGPVIAGRLRGTAFQLAMSLTALRFYPHTQTYLQLTGDELLSQGSDAGHADPQGIQVPPQHSGGRLLLRRLEQEYGVTAQYQSIAALDSFFVFQRGSLSLSL